jgi:diguanylate cyclase (GGDEF)-like protein
MRILANTNTLLLFVPLAAVLSAWIGLAWLEPFPDSALQLLTLAPFLIFGLGAAVAAYFKVSNPVLQFALLLFTQIVLARTETMPPIVAVETIGVLQILVPLNFAVLGVLEDRGLLTYDGFVRLFAVAVQGVLAVSAVLIAPGLVDDILALTILPLPLPMTQPALLAAAIGIGVAILAFRRKGTPLEAGTVVATVALLLAFTRPASSAGATFLICVAGAILAIAVLQNGYRLAFLDELTALPGRRALQMELKRISGPCAIAMLDVDFFKKFNDTYGHDVGDQALRLVAKCLRQVGGGGRPFRYGGEEFTVLFPGMSAQEAVPVLEDLRALVESTPFQLRAPDRPKRASAARRRRGSGTRSRNLHLTVSIGVADRTDIHRPVEAVIRAADKALYRAKLQGRNRVAQ